MFVILHRVTLHSVLNPPRGKIKKGRRKHLISASFFLLAEIKYFCLPCWRTINLYKKADTCDIIYSQIIGSAFLRLAL
jgi:hypothetical protein